MMATFDDRGRLFICESSGNTLNNTQMAANPDYRIRVLEDRNGDGVFDYEQSFRGQAHAARWGRLVSQQSLCRISTRLLRFEDTNGDGVADVKEVIVTGWNMSANAASLHGPFFGPDGWLYLTDGRHGFDINTKDGRHYKGLDPASGVSDRTAPDSNGLRAAGSTTQSRWTSLRPAKPSGP